MSKLMKMIIVVFFAEGIRIMRDSWVKTTLYQDAVSRQQVIDTIMGEYYYPCYFAEMIRELPTATHPKIIRCVDCKHWKNEHLCESLSRFGSFETKADFYCGYAERKINERTG